jgi:hypothetical protein
MNELQNEKKSVRIQDMADGIRISKKSLENYRDGASQPTVEVLERIAIYFGKDMNYFFDKQEEVTKTTQMVASPVELYEPPKELAECYKIMYEQQVELGKMSMEIERLKKLCARDMNAGVG